MKNRKDLKDQYKQLKPKMGVFQIRNQVNDAVFIDSSIDVETKWNRHQAELKFGTHKNIALQADWNKYGASKFEFEVIQELDYKVGENINYHKEVALLEEMAIEEMAITAHNCYNFLLKSRH